MTNVTQLNNSLDALPLADIVGDSYGVEVVKKAWNLQGETNFHFFLTRLYEIYQITDPEVKCYIIYIYSRMIEKGILILDPDVEDAEEYFFYNFLPDAINLRAISHYLLENTICVEDLKDVIVSHNILGEELITETYAIKLIKVLEENLRILTKNEKFPEIFEIFLKETYQFLHKIVKIFGEDGDLLEERYHIYFYTRKRLLQILFFFHCLNFGTLEDVKTSFDCTFQNIRSKDFKLLNSSSFLMVMSLKPNINRVLEVFHIIVKKMPSKVKI